MRVLEPCEGTDANRATLPRLRRIVRCPCLHNRGPICKWPGNPAAILIESGDGSRLQEGAVEHVQPEGLLDSQRFGFTQVVVSSPGRLVFVSGQTALDAELRVVGDDLAGQAGQALENLRVALAAVGAKPADVASLRIYVVDFEPRNAAEIAPALARFFDGGPPSAQTMIGVSALAVPGLRIEIEANAVVAD